MPSLRRHQSRASKKAHEQNNDGAPASQSEDNESSPTTSKSPAKRTLRSNQMGRAESNASKDPTTPSPINTLAESKSPATNSPAAPPSKKQPPSMSTSISPSPYQVVSDLLDATCHEIILLEGKDPESIAPFTSYAILAQRLEYYMEQLDRDQENSEEEEGGDAAGKSAEEEEWGDAADDGIEKQPILKDPTVRCRLFMAKLTLDVCARLAYSELFVDTSETQQPGSNLPALINLSASKWHELSQELGKLHDRMQSNGGDEGMDPLFESLNCQMEALEALAKLRYQLRAVVAEINREDGKKRSASQFSYVGGHLDEYKATSDVINGKLQNIHQTSYSDLCVPHQMLTLKRGTTIERVKDSVISLIEGIDDMITKKVFPLQNFQVQFLKLVKTWEKSDLPPPALFKAGYFKCNEPSSPQAKAASRNASTLSPSATSASPGRASRGRLGPRRIIPKDEYQSDNSNDSPVVKKKKARVRSSPGKARGYKSPRKKAKRKPKQYDSDSDSFMSDKAPARKLGSPKKRGKRIPYSDEEKISLLEGVQTFGVGKWADIREEYEDVFKVNKRTNVNLKDLYRTLTGPPRKIKVDEEH
mmetsp:Transcript_32976/g.69404  ORF Transcript_32976/g.69404 Transcript_32976/m.69404 type:complete len:589 (+) Transcript_32976:173-1939(+)|eukprot:CAMPEP_0172298642 /NCGR_PEP_ID=MMETSP1058-20130122/1200_1 /TAXON_ID=83371 /ORGANISM="Detonula confervacea, Strain CCMP 353" /LENGTH=588 /DNA_ID=CAMNT_0013007923 /DNA_START=101 /DNA_END=1867 /DNA_ORIENTATION=-